MAVNWHGEGFLSTISNHAVVAIYLIARYSMTTKFQLIYIIDMLLVGDIHINTRYQDKILNGLRDIFSTYPDEKTIIFF
jgi:hypothetical protein